MPPAKPQLTRKLVRGFHLIWKSFCLNSGAFDHLKFKLIVFNHRLYELTSILYLGHRAQRFMIDNYSFLAVRELNFSKSQIPIVSRSGAIDECPLHWEVSKANTVNAQKKNLKIC